MEALQKGLLELVKVGSTSECQFSEALYRADWNDLQQLAAEQGVACLGMRGLETLHNRGIDICPQDPKLRLYARSQQVERMSKERDALSREFAALVLPYKLVVLKGVDYARFWPNPRWREFGDLDSWAYADGKTHDECFAESNELARKGGALVEENSYKHNHIHYKGLTIENHACLTSFEGREKGRKDELMLQELLNSGALTQIEDSNLYSPSNEFTAVFMLVHAYRHFIMEGISLRQILDWNFFVLNNKGNVDWKTVITILKELRLVNFAAMLTTFCKNSMGLRTDLFADVEIGKKIIESFTEDIFQKKFATSDRRITIIIARLCNRFRRMYTFRNQMTMPLYKAVWMTFSYSSVLDRHPEL